MILRRLILALLLLASPAWAAIAVEGSVSTGESGLGTTTSLSFSHTVPGSLSNSLLIVGVSIAHSNDDVTDVTWNGVSMTRVRSDTSLGTSGGARSYIYRLLAPASATANVVVTLGTARRVVAGAITFSGVDQTTPFGTATGDNSGSGGTNGPAQVNVTSATGEVVIDTVAKRDDTETLTVGADQTQRWNLGTTTAGANDVLGGGSTEPGAGTVTMSWSWTTATRTWAITAVPIKEASGSPAAAARRRVLVVQ